MESIKGINLVHVARIIVKEAEAANLHPSWLEELAVVGAQVGSMQGQRAYVYLGGCGCMCREEVGYFFRLASQKQDAATILEITKHHDGELYTVSVMHLR